MGSSSHSGIRKCSHNVWTSAPILLLLPNLISGGLVNLGMVSLKGSIGIGLRPKGEHTGPLISTYYGHGLGPGAANHGSGSGSVSSSPGKGHSKAPNFVTSCCKGKLKLFGQNIFGHGHFKGQYIKGPSSATVTNYHHLHNQHSEPGGGGGGGGTSGLGVVSVNEIHEGGDHPVKLKDYNSYKHRQYPKHSAYHPYKDEGGGYPNSYNFRQFKTPPPVQGYQGQGPDHDHDSPPPFWSGNKEGQNQGGQGPLVIDGGNKGPHHSDGEGYQQHHDHEDNHHGPPPPNSDSYPPHLKDGPGSNYHDNPDEGHGGGGGYPPSHNDNRDNGYHHDYSETDGIYHSHPNSGPGPNSHSSSFSNSIYEHEPHHDDKPGGYPSPTNYRNGKVFDDSSPFSPSPMGGVVGPSRDYASAKSAPPPMQIIDHHHPPPGSYHGNEEGSPPLPFNGQGQRGQGGQVEQDTKYPIFPSYPPPPPPPLRRNVRNGFTTPQFRPIPRSSQFPKLSSLLPTQPMIPMADPSSWMPFKGQLQGQPQGQSPGQERTFNFKTKSAKSATSKPDKDLKYRVYEYGKNEVIVIDGGLKPHEKDLVRAHVYSKDKGKLLRTIEIKDALGGGSSKTVASSRSDTISPGEEEEGDDVETVLRKARLSFDTTTLASMSTSTPMTPTTPIPMSTSSSTSTTPTSLQIEEIVTESKNDTLTR